MTNFGLCVRTGYWTPALAEAQGALGQNCQCDTDIIKCEAGAERVTLSADTLFAFNKAVLKPEGIAKLTELTSRMSGLTLDVVMINGYADRIGAAAYNQKLSEKRAASVKDYLVSKGIPANRVYTEGKGSKQPVTKPDQCKGAKSAKVIACLQPDRRVDIEIIGTKK